LQIASFVLANLIWNYHRAWNILVQSRQHRSVSLCKFR
jgi:hypothetical protein